MRLLAIAATALLAVCAASADTVKDGAIQVQPGKWKWKQETNIMAIPLNEENLECLIPEKARITLSKLARDLEEGCKVDNVLPISGGFSFKLICEGKTTGKADATLTHTPTSMKIRATGSQVSAMTRRVRGPPSAEITARMRVKRAPPPGEPSAARLSAGSR